MIYLSDAVEAIRTAMSMARTSKRSFVVVVDDGRLMVCEPCQAPSRCQVIERVNYIG